MTRDEKVAVLKEYEQADYANAERAWVEYQATAAIRRWAESGEDGELAFLVPKTDLYDGVFYAALGTVRGCGYEPVVLESAGLSYDGFVLGRGNVAKADAEAGTPTLAERLRSRSDKPTPLTFDEVVVLAESATDEGDKSVYVDPKRLADEVVARLRGEGFAVTPYAGGWTRIAW